MQDLNDLALDELYRHLARSGWVTRLLELARDEDLGERWETEGDVTSKALTMARAQGRGLIMARRAGVIAGLAAVPEILHVFRADADFSEVRGIHDGSRVEPGTVIGTVDGNLRAILGAERTILNLLGRLSGVATRTAEFVGLAKGAKSAIYDTRKTTPGMRSLEKYAVRCGGGRCHRLGLYDAALIKDNHLAGVRLEDLPAVVDRAVRLAREEAPRDGLRFVELEVDSLDQLRRLLDSGSLGPGNVEIILLDNMAAPDLRQAVEMRDARGTSVLLEASGGIHAGNIAEIARTGVDRISLGTLTHGAPWLDIALDVEGAGHSSPRVDG